MKKNVHYSILNDMKKYIENLNVDDYESTGAETDPSVINALSIYYAQHLPVDVTAWIRVNKPDENLIYGPRLGEQVCFIRDVICPLFLKDFWETQPLVISTHVSKSVKLPVYQIDLKQHGIEIILRNNFYDWKVSIKSDKTLNFDCMGLFNPSQYINPIYCEGFPKEKVYGCYSESHSKFTFEVRTNYELYTFMFLLKNYLGVK